MEGIKRGEMFVFIGKSDKGKSFLNKIHYKIGDDVPVCGTTGFCENYNSKIIDIKIQYEILQQAIHIQFISLKMDNNLMVEQECR